MNISIDGLLERVGLLRKPHLGLALGGGGARGFSHVGVFMAMEEFGLRPDIMAGVSAGSIAATLYSSGLTPKDIIKCFDETHRFTDYTEWTIPKDGLLKLTPFAKMLESWLSVKYLEDLSIPTVVCATNLDRGTSVGWCRGEIVPRVLASCSIPIVFQPITINGVNYVDGGVLRNLPAWPIRDYCKTLIGSNCSPLNRQYSYKRSIIDTALRTYQLMSKANVLQDIKLCDYVISPASISKIKTFDMTSFNDNATAGYEVACRVLETYLNKK